MLFGKNLVTDNAITNCHGDNEGSGLRGNLGIDEIIATALRYTTGYPYADMLPYKLPAIGVTTLLGPLTL